MSDRAYFLMAVVSACLCAGVALAGAAISFLMVRRTERLLREARKDRLGLDQAFLERCKRELLGWEPKKEKGSRPS